MSTSLRLARSLMRGASWVAKAWYCPPVEAVAILTSLTSSLHERSQITSEITAKISSVHAGTFFSPSQILRQVVMGIW